ncbi:hypothetical protein F383_08705 [Gossypium arboreum]|uniref:Uncharacterized protein n=1 Tax=Gossypium arboreum TaxID=29729 RepID=A0A0B0PJ36_GOSAR|nr:hypothetical protein F383_08705 [Gossypium arboreum]
MFVLACQITQNLGWWPAKLWVKMKKTKKKKNVHLLTSLAENAKKKGEGEVKYSATPSSLE